MVSDVSLVTYAPLLTYAPSMMSHSACSVVSGRLRMTVQSLSILADDAPAGGAAYTQVFEASLIFAVLLGGLALATWRHRRGHPTVLNRLAERVAARVGFPAWAALPMELLRGSLLVALFGMYWDISLHIGKGRDPGPLANPAHWFILVGLSGIFAAGAVALTLDHPPLPRRTLRLGQTWRGPVGGGLLLGCGAFSLLGFPLDDVWHRLFGQDVTLFGPTHLMLIGGAALATLGGWLLILEGVQVSGTTGGWWLRTNEYAAAGALLIGLSTFQAEFDFGVPQFRLVLEPVMIMAAGSVALVAARVRLGRGGALACVLFFLAVRGLLTFVVAVPLGRPVAHFPLYLAEALLVEGAALAVGTRSLVRFGAVAGALVGTVGLAAEWGWSHVWSVIPWPAALLPEAAVLGFVTALGGALVGAWVGGRLVATAAPEAAPVTVRPALLPRLVAPLAGAAVIACIAVALPITTGSPVHADVTLREVAGGPERTVLADIRLTPADAADDAAWFVATAWQGDNGTKGEVVDSLRRTGPGTWTTTQPIPVSGSWKSTLRLQRGSDVLGVAVYLPGDTAIPAQEVAATPTFSRDFQLDKQLLQREAKQGVAGWLTTTAYLVVGALAVLALLCMALGLGFAARPRGDRPPRGSGHAGGAANGALRTPATS
jgi:hypothetical protein